VATAGRGARARDDKASRYREAAELALKQLDWCISYLRQIRKPGIARALEENRREIARRYEL
jgi:hypothetical protein